MHEMHIATRECVLKLLTLIELHVPIVGIPFCHMSRLHIDSTMDINFVSLSNTDPREGHGRRLKSIDARAEEGNLLVSQAFPFTQGSMT